MAGCTYMKMVFTTFFGLKSVAIINKEERKEYREKAV